MNEMVRSTTRHFQIFEAPMKSRLCKEFGWMRLFAARGTDLGHPWLPQPHLAAGLRSPAHLSEGLREARVWFWTALGLGVRPALGFGPETYRAFELHSTLAAVVIGLSSTRMPNYDFSFHPKDRSSAMQWLSLAFVLGCGLFSWCELEP